MGKQSRRRQATRSDLTNSIIEKWNEQRMFIRFIDGNTLNCAATNLHPVTLKDAMENVHTWKVDWDMNLTQEERNLVLTDEWREGLRL